MLAHRRQFVAVFILGGVLVVAGIFLIPRTPSSSFAEQPVKETLDAKMTNQPPTLQTFVATVQEGKAAFEAIQTQMQETIEAGPHAPNPDLGAIGTLTPQASCPNPTPPSTPGLVPPGLMLMPFFTDGGITSEADAILPNGDMYQIWAGAPIDAPEKGVVIVVETLRDPCYSYWHGTEVPSSNVEGYNAPKGPLTLTQLDGETVVFSIAGGGTGRFDFVTRQFLP